MPQDSRHPLYDKLLPQWQRCRATTEGTDAVKARGELDLPRPSGMTDTQYQAYKTRAPVFNASSRTLESWTSPVFRKAPVIIGPSRLLDQMGDVTGTGMPFDAFALFAFTETFCGHAGLLLDLPTQALAVNTLAPQWTCYQAEQIINWEVTRQADGTMALTHVMLQEMVDERDPQDRYAHISVMQWRELEIRNNEYTVTVWRRSASSSTGFVPVQGPYTPNRMEVPLTFIPFDMDLIAATSPPPLLDIVDMNLAHYRSGADYKHALHWTGMKTPWVVANADLPAMHLGGLKLLHIKAPASEVAIGLLEPNGDSLAAQLADLNAMEQQMAILGARMLEPQKRSVETAEALGMHQSGEQSVLQDVAQTMSQRLTRVLRWHAWWAVMVDTPNDPSISVQLNKDLVPKSLAPQDLDALSAAYHQGRIMTQESVYYNLQQGEMLAPDEDLATYVARLATQAESREPVVKEGEF